MLKNIIVGASAVFTAIFGAVFLVLLNALPWIAVIGFCYWLFFM